MKSRVRSLVLGIALTAACTEVIGLSSYEKVDDLGQSGEGGEDENRAGTSAGGRAGGHTGGTSGEAGAPSVQAGEGGTPSTASEGGAGGRESEGGSGGAPEQVGGSPGSSGAGGSGGGESLGGEGGGGPGQVCTEQELLVDGSFDEDSEAWISTGPEDFEIVVQPRDFAVSPPNVAWLGGIDPAEVEVPYVTAVWQYVVIPENASSLLISCAVSVAEGEGEAPPETEDSAWIVLSDAETFTVLLESPPWTRDDVSDWKIVELTVSPEDTEPLRGLGVSFDLLSENNGPTSFFFDDCSLRVVCE